MNVYNFSAGPSALAASVKNQIHEEFFNFANLGVNIAEISHRSAEYERLNEQAHARLLRLYGLDERDWAVCFATGGATAQMSLMAKNFAPNARVGIIDTDIWTARAIEQMRADGVSVDVLASSASEGYSHIPAPFGEEFCAQPPGGQNAVTGKKSSSNDFVYLCSNNTVAGTQFAALPGDLGDLVVDASSDFLSQPVDFSRVKALFAGAQKNAGIAGITPVIFHREWLARSDAAAIAPIFRYAEHARARSLFNTPPTFSVYVFSLVLEFIEREGGLSAMAAHNAAKSAALYEFLDASEFFRPLVARDRSKMNVCFATPSAELDAKFVAQSTAAGLLGLKGHKSKGGLRASIYNACTMQAVRELIAFCERFEKENKCL